MQIRTLSTSDAAVFQELRLRGLQELPSAFASSYEEEAETPIAVVAQRLAPQPDRAMFGAFKDQQLIGLVGLQREPMRKLAHKAFIWGMYVEPDARRRGVGRRLVAHALAFAANELRVRQVSLGVNARNLGAIALYRSLGFEQFGFERGFMLVDGELHDELHLVCFV